MEVPRNEESELTEALMKMRSRLRDENERILLELQDDTTRRIEKEMKEKLQNLNNYFNEQKQILLSLLLQSLQQRLHHLTHSSDDEDTHQWKNLQEIICNIWIDEKMIPFPTILVPYEEEITRIAKELLHILLSVMRQHEDALFYEQRGDPSSFIEDKEEEIEKIGQEDWSTCMEMAKEEWSEMGCKRLAIEERYKALLQHEEDTMIKYIHDQVAPILQTDHVCPSDLSTVGSCL